MVSKAVLNDKDILFWPTITILFTPMYMYIIYPFKYKAIFSLLRASFHHIEFNFSAKSVSVCGGGGVWEAYALQLSGFPGPSETKSAKTSNKKI